MITTSDETWATDALRDAQDPGAGAQQWKPLTRLTLERYNLTFTQQHSRGYASTGQPEHDAGTALEDGFATLLKVAVGTASDDMVFSKWSVASGLEYDDVSIVPGASLSDTAAPSMEITAGESLTIRVFYIDEDDNYIHYKESSDGGGTWGAEQNVGGLDNAKAIASVSTSRVHCISYASGSTRFHVYNYNGSWAKTDSLIYWPHQIDHIDAITIGDRDLIVFYSEGCVWGDEYQEGGVYGIWYEHSRWSDIFKIDVVDEESDYAYRKHPMLSTANSLYFLTLYISEGDADYSTATRAVKISKDGENWSQYMPLSSCPEAGPAKLLVVNAASGQSWPWSTGQQVYVVGFDKVYESDATRLVGESNGDLQVDVTSRCVGWELSRGVIAQGNTILSNHDGTLDSHSIINSDNILLLKREAGYYTSSAEYAQLTMEAVDFIAETDRLPQRHKQVTSRDFMAWVRDKEADHYEEWLSQLVGYDTFDDDTETGYGGLMHTATQKGWWQTENNVLWLRSDNEMGLAFMTWSSEIMNGQVKSAIRIETASNGEYAGLVFRAKDEGNFWACYYNEGTDKIILRQRAGDAWMPIAAQSSGTRSWSVDTWYYLMVDFRYNYIRVFYSTDGLTWTQDFTHTITPNALNPSPGYGYVGVIGYGYSSEDGEEEWGYVEPTPPVTPPAAGSGELLYATCLQTGRVFRTRNARCGDATAVSYEDLGVVDAGGLLWLALDSWDPKNCAMVCGSNGVWKTTNLNDTTPTWTCVLDLSGSNQTAYMVRSSICVEDYWGVVTQDATPGRTMYYYYTGDGGGSWSNTQVTANALDTTAPDPKLEFSSHDGQTLWITWHNAVGTPAKPYVSKSGDGGATFAAALALATGGGYWPSNSHHRYLDNDDDGHALCAGHETVQKCLNDFAGGGCTTHSTTVNARWIECFTWGTTKYWLLSTTGSGSKVFISDDAETWTEQYDLPGSTRHMSGWSYNGDWLYAAQDGTTAPLLISSDRGESFQAQTGNWNTLCTAGSYDPDITCVAVVFTE